MINTSNSESKNKYITEIINSVKKIISSDYLFTNYKNQIFVKKLGVKFNNTYSEDYLWRRALSLSTNACFLLLNSKENDLSSSALKESAEIYEYLNKVSTKYDKDYFIILSALCYDISGYQANALCLVRDLVKRNELYRINSDESMQEKEIINENYLLYHIQQILQKKIYLGRGAVKENSDLGIKTFNESINSFYNHILYGRSEEYLEKFKLSYQFYLHQSNVYISHLLYLLLARLKTYQERSIWENLLKVETISGNQIWQKYIKLLTHDFYDENRIKKVDDRVSKFEFWISQLRAIEKGIVGSKENFVVQMPTSAGKTFIAELAIVDSLINNPGKKCIYVAPFRALTNEKELELSANLSKLGYTVSAISGDYEMDDGQSFLLNSSDVLIATPEKVDLLLRMYPEIYGSISMLIVDEGHIIGNDDERSSLIEFLVIRLRMKLPDLRIIFISAVMPEANATQFSVWLNRSKNNVIRSQLFTKGKEQWEPTRKLIASFRWTNANGMLEYLNINNEEEKTRKKSGAFISGFIRSEKINRKTFPNVSKKNEAAASIAYKLANEGNCLIFCSRPDYAKSAGLAFLDLLALIERKERVLPCFLVNKSTESYVAALEWFGSDSYITKCISRGVGVHFGDLPEQVRRAIEKDYQSGKLRLLICTNTIGQGLNFPIKNLIIHSLVIHQQENIHISVRDFWNIVGRAGRAGKETEGQIIFLTLTQNDVYLFQKYTNKENIEEANSPFLKILLEYYSKRLPSLSNLDDEIQRFSESYLMDMLEEDEQGNDKKLVEGVLKNSLVNIQAIDRKIDIKPFENGISSTIVNIRKSVIDKEMLEVFGKTGFSLKSSLQIDTYILENIEIIRKLIVDDNYRVLLTHILKLFDRGLKETALKKFEFKENICSDCEPLVLKWINGDSIKKLRKEWENKYEADHFLNFFSDGLSYRFPWGITTFVTIAAYRLNIPQDALPNNIRNLAGYVKYGVNSSAASTARRLGVKSREVSLLIADNSKGRIGEEFLKWFSNLQIEEVKGWDEKLTEYDLENILSVAIKINPVKQSPSVPTEFKFSVKGLYYYRSNDKVIGNLKVGDKLEYSRDYTNIYDPFAIKIMYRKNQIGHVPRENSKTISTEIDLNEKKYMLTIINISRRKNVDGIEVLMREV